MICNTVSEFYHTKEWENLLKVLRIERLNPYGYIICEYCGKPITKAYDIIGHHKVELTAENVNDAAVSLNPDNIQFVHHRCHNFIHNKLGYAVREVFVVYGAPLAGKSEYVREAMSEGDLVVDIDSIWQCVSGCPRYVKPNRLRSIVFTARNALIEAVRYRQGKWNTAYIIGGYALSSERTRLCKELGAREVCVESTFDDCVHRLDDLPYLNREEWIGYISEWFRSVC